MTFEVRDIVSATAANGGGTFEAGTLLPFEPTDGYAVAIASVARLSVHTPAAQLVDTARRVAQEYGSSFVGTWVHEGYVYVDPVQYVRDRERAIRIGREHGQQAIYSFGDQEVITL